MTTASRTRAEGVARIAAELLADLRHALRLAHRRPTYAATMTGTLAVALGATTIVVALSTAVLWRPLPFPAEERLVLLWEAVTDERGHSASRVTSATFVAWRDTFDGFESMAAFGAAGFTATGAGDAVQLSGSRVTADYFRVLASTPILGRTFTAEDGEPGHERIIVLSEGLWRARFGGRADAIGATIRLDDAPYTVVGVMPSAVYPGRPVTPATLVISGDRQQFWIPIPRAAAFATNQRSHVYGVIGRLRPGVSLEQARDEARASEDAQGRSRLGDSHGVTLTPLREQLTRDVRPMILTVLAAVAAVLLICCANLASLFALHVDGRGRELAVRSAIGASDGRLMRQLVAEALLLSFAGAAFGLLGASTALPILPAWLPDAVPLLTDLSIDWRVTAICLAVTMLVSVVLATWPVVRVRRIRAGALRGVSAASPMRGHRWLVVGEVSLALTLSVAAGLLGRSLQNVGAQDVGFDADHLVSFDVKLPASRARQLEEVLAFERRIGEALRRTPGVRSVAFGYDTPLEANWIDVVTFVGERESDVNDASRSAWLRIVSPGYFETVGTRLVTGRVFEIADDLSRPGVVVVNRAFVNAFLRDRPVIGTRIRSAAPRMNWGDAVPAEFQIVGVVADERFRGLEQPTPPAYFLPTTQFPQGGFSCLVRADGNLRALAPLLAETVRATDGQVPVSRMTTMREAIEEQLGNRRVMTQLVVVFGAAAVMLAAIGLYGLLAMVVASRSREIAVRVALGAHPAGIARSVLFQGVRYATVGVLTGLVGAWMASRTLASLLFDVRPFDPLTIGAVVALLLGVAGVAAWRPARQAARTDPIAVLRAEP